MTLHTPNPTSTAAPPGRLGRVLVVDDDPASLAHIAGALGARGHQVVPTCDGHEALGEIGRGVPDLVVLDVMMPGMSGIEVCRRIRAEHERLDLPVVFVTALSDEASRRRCWGAGGNDFLSRPVSDSELLVRVGNLVLLGNQHRLLARRAEELEMTVAERTAELRDSQEEAILRLATAVELRDGITAEHGVRVGAISGLIAEELQWAPRRCQELRLAAAMHDVGKVAIPDRILMKPGKLTHDEYELMKRHSPIGEQLIGGGSSRLLALAATIAGTHHERLDGSGYPGGLRGEAIPLPGRIAAVADVFDAITTARRYRGAMPLDRSLTIMEEGRGAMFDSEVLDAFMARLPAIIQVGEQLGVPCLSLLDDVDRLDGPLETDTLRVQLDEVLTGTTPAGTAARVAALRVGAASSSDCR